MDIVKSFPLNKTRYTFEELYNGALKQIPIGSGIYKVYKPEGFQMVFRSDSDAPFVNEQLIDAAILQEKWNRVLESPGYEENLLYIGKAKNLRRRIRQYVRTGYGKAINHSGGRVIFQLENNKKLEIEYYEYENCKEIEAIEIEKYILNRGVLPFANWKKGEKYSNNTGIEEPIT